MNLGNRSKILKEDLEIILNNCRDTLNELSGAKILITGISGFFGKWITKSIIHYNLSAKEKIQVIGLTRSIQKTLSQNPFFSNDDIQLLEIDLLSDEINLDVEVDYIIHAANDVSQNLSSNSNEVLENERKITQNVLKIIEKSNLKRFLYTSSGAVYGSYYYSEGKIEESDFLKKEISSVYGKSKIETERSIISWCDNHEIEYQVLRCFAFTGAFIPLEASFAVGNFINDLLHKRDISLSGSGKVYRSYMYMTDLVTWIFGSLVHEKKNQVFNVGSDDPITILDAAHLIAGSSVNVSARSDDDSSDYPSYVPSIKLANYEFGFKCDFSSEEAILRTVKSFLF